MKLGQVEGQLDELKKAQLQLAHRLNRDLIGMRYKAYGRLWARTEPTKLYATDEFGPATVAALGKSLTGWYFSAAGGLLLTEKLKDFYFALQDLVLAVGRLKEPWTCLKRPRDPKIPFARLLNGLDLTDHELKDQLLLLPEKPTELHPAKWRKVCKAVAARLESLVTAPDPRAGLMVYVAIQQVASILRSNLAHELGSRIQVERPTTG